MSDKNVTPFLICFFGGIVLVGVSLYFVHVALTLAWFGFVALGLSWAATQIEGGKDE